MNNLIDQVRTPEKLGSLVLTPSYQKGTFDSHAVDCPFLFLEGETFYMTYVGWDGIGYRTGLASSEDLIHWQKLGLLIDRGLQGSVTEFNIALTSILRDNALFGPGRLKKVNGLYIGTYHAYPQPGYETGPAVIGLCFSSDLRHWEIGEAMLKPDPACEWESGGLYKSWLMEYGGTYYLFYNAKNLPQGAWIEQTGVAFSQDLVHWEKYARNPILKVGARGEFDDIFVSDPCVLQVDGHSWAMFFFGNSSDGHARESVAFSENLLAWEKSGEILVDVGREGSCDSVYAHKASMICKDGALYHFYCAVAPALSKNVGDIFVEELRGISAAVRQHNHKI